MVVQAVGHEEHQLAIGCCAAVVHRVTVRLQNWCKGCTDVLQMHTAHESDCHVDSTAAYRRGTRGRKKTRINHSVHIYTLYHAHIKAAHKAACNNSTTIAGSRSYTEESFVVSIARMRFLFQVLRDTSFYLVTTRLQQRVTGSGRSMSRRGSMSRKKVKLMTFTARTCETQRVK